MNSSLIDCIVKSPNHSGVRTHKIDRITPHCVVGQLSAESIGHCFINRQRKASSNYGIGADGKVCLIVDEDNRAWTSSSTSNDNRAITIECASDKIAPYKFKDEVYNKLIDLTVDIMKRYNKNTLIYIKNKDEALKYEPKDNEMLLTFHRWFKNKSCPGDWFISKADEYTDIVNKRLNNIVEKEETTETEFKVGDKVKLKQGAKQYDGKGIREDYFAKEYNIRSIKGDRVVLDIDKVVVYAVNIRDIESTLSEYKVKVMVNSLIIREGPSTLTNKKGSIRDKGVYTIVEEQNGWGRLKSNIGWISLKCTERI